MQKPSDETSSNMNYLHHNIAYLIKSGVLKKSAAKKNYSVNDLIAVSKATGYSLDDLVNVDIKRKINSQKQKIKMLCLDVDGVLTDGGMYYSETGDELKKFNTKDGLGIKSLIKNGVKVGFISNGKNNQLIENRAKLLGVEKVYVGKDDKMNVMKKWLKETKLSWNNIAYVCDDINDLEVIKNVALSACPNDASPKIKSASHIILNKNGGEGCVREFIDHYLL